MKERVIVLVVGLAYLALAVVGFAETGTSDFTRHPENVVLGFGVSTLLNVVHAGTGVLAIGLAATRGDARVFGMLGTVAYIALFAYGVVAAIDQGPRRAAERQLGGQLAAPGHRTDLPAGRAGGDAKVGQSW